MISNLTFYPGGGMRPVYQYFIEKSNNLKIKVQNSRIGVDI